MALSDFEKSVALLLNEGRQPDAIAEELGVNVDAVLEAKDAYERWDRCELCGAPLGQWTDANGDPLPGLNGLPMCINANCPGKSR